MQFQLGFEGEPLGDHCSTDLGGKTPLKLLDLSGEEPKAMEVSKAIRGAL